MKNIIVMLLVVVAASLTVSAKKDKKDPKDVQIDSLTTANKNLSLVSDSLSKELGKVYLVLKERVVKRDFDATKIPQVIDSIATEIDSSMHGLRSSKATLMDSIAILKKENAKMKTTLDGITTDETGKNRIVAELRTLKGLLDEKILTQTEYDAKKARLLEKW